MSLGKALADAGKTQRWLAEELGVSTAAVNHWVKGNAPIPPKRVTQIADVLGSVVQVSVDYGTILTDPAARTPLGYTILWPLNSVEGASTKWEPRSAQALERRVTVLSQITKANKQQIEDAIMGRGYLEAQDLNTIAEVMGGSAEQLAEVHLGHRRAEKQAVWDALDTASIRYSSFDDCIADLVAAKRQWKTEGLIEGPGPEGMAVSAAEEVDMDWWLDGEDSPMEIESKPTQNLAGRYGGMDSGNTSGEA